MLFIAGISIAVFIQILLLSKKSKNQSDRWLALWVFALATHLFFYYLVYSGQAFEYPFLLGLEMPLPLLHPVMLYIYTAQITRQLPECKWSLIFHFIPALVVLFYLVFNFYGLPAASKVYTYQNNGAGFETFVLLKNIVIYISGVAYISWSTWLLVRHQRNVRDQYAYVEKIDLKWLRTLTLGLGIIWLVVIFLDSELLTFGAVAIFVIIVGFLGIRQGRVFDTPTPQPPPVTDKKEKYARSGLKTSQSDDLFSRLKILMEEQEFYKQNDLSNALLAETLDVHVNTLSQVINERTNHNFYDFVNGYRVAEFKRLLDDPKNHNLTLLALAYECGFNSKSSFNRYFKKATGQTPSQYFAEVKSQ